MNWQSFSSKIQKIKILAENAEKDGQVSRLERDLLASYVRDLYDLILDDGGLSLHPAAYKKEVSQATPVLQKAEVLQNPEPVQITDIPTPSPKVEVAEIPVIQKSEVVQKPVVTEIPAPPPAPEIQENPVVVQPVTIQTPATSLSDPSLLAELFAEEKVSDLSDKLASQKISDLTKAMGINEKIFTIQELFNNDNQLFNDTLAQLNGLPDFNAAKAHLTQYIIPKLDWTSDKKLKKAVTFIKLVRRRYM